MIVREWSLYLQGPGHGALFVHGMLADYISTRISIFSPGLIRLGLWLRLQDRKHPTPSMGANGNHVRCPILSLALTLRWCRRVLLLAATPPGRIMVLAIIAIN